jgi:hypothetical protein
MTQPPGSRPGVSDRGAPGTPVKAADRRSTNGEGSSTPGLPPAPATALDEETHMVERNIRVRRAEALQVHVAAPRSLSPLRSYAPPAGASVVHPPVLPPDPPRTARLLHGLTGLGLLVMGLAAVGQGGFAGSATERTASVLGITLNTGLGLVLTGIGLLLVVAGLLRNGRLLGGITGALLVAGGVLLAAATDDLLHQLRAGRQLGWLLIVLGGVAVLAAFLHRTHVRPELPHAAGATGDVVTGDVVPGDAATGDAATGDVATGDAVTGPARE